MSSRTRSPRVSLSLIRLFFGAMALLALLAFVACGSDPAASNGSGDGGTGGGAGDAGADPDAGPTCPEGTRRCDGECRDEFEACGSCDHDCRDLIDPALAGAPIPNANYELRACLVDRCHFVSMTFQRQSCTSFCNSLGLTCVPVRGGGGIIGIARYPGAGELGWDYTDSCGETPSEWLTIGMAGHMFSNLQCACEES